MERAILPALLRPPCMVSFSGGMDSSFVLAIAARIARREGLPVPIPVTWRFKDAPRAEESAWQDRVVDALRLDDRTVLHAGDDLDLVGPVAQRLLGRHGVLHPVNVHLHLPLVEAAAGGSLLTGAGGDQVLSRRRRRAITRSRALVPGGLAAAVRCRHHDPCPWLRPTVARRVHRAFRAEMLAGQRAPKGRIAWPAGRRDLQMTCSSLAAVAADHDVRLVNPLLDADVLLALTAPGLEGLSRAELLSAVAPADLPAAVVAPRPKAYFREVFLRDPTRRFVGSWDGRGVDEDLVDVDALARAWSVWPIPPGTAGLVQQAWLASTAKTPKPEPMGCARDD
jgi:asparagine synthase (glutamine-hydrolysing)